MKNPAKILFIFCLLYFVSSCKKEDDFTSDSSVKLSFSEDTILFDTIFTTIGSTTQFLSVYNKEGSSIRISSIRLAKGTASSYRINVDGVPGKSFANVEIGPKDSLFIFIEVTVDPNNLTTPFLITDSILFETNGNLQDIDLVAFGQNAHFITPSHSFYGLPYSIIGGDNVSCGTTITWDSILPYVIYGYGVVDSCIKLVITEGTKIYFYQNSGLWVYQGGTLKVNGSFDHRVTFQGTRLEQSYQDIPGQWDRIWINEGVPGQESNDINYAIIKNGFIGLQPENFLSVIGGNPQKLNVSNTIIENMSGFGMLARDYKVNACNNLITNCGQYAIALTYGGKYDFLHCTIGNYWSQGQRATPSIYINNYFTDQTGDVAADLDSAVFKNCILYGNIDNELQFDFIAGADSNYFFGNCLLKVDSHTSTADPVRFQNIISNQDPQFTGYSDDDYTLDASSPCIDAGNAVFTDTLSHDLNSKARIVGSAPDLGSYEKQ